MLHCICVFFNMAVINTWLTGSESEPITAGRGWRGGAGGLMWSTCCQLEKAGTNVWTLKLDYLHLIFNILQTWRTNVSQNLSTLSSAGLLWCFQRVFTHRFTRVCCGAAGWSVVGVTLWRNLEGFMVKVIKRSGNVNGNVFTFATTACVRSRVTPVSLVSAPSLWSVVHS